MIILQILSLILWLFVVPFCVGLLPFPLLEKRLRTPGAALIAGYIISFTALELVGIPVVLLAVYNGFSIFRMSYTPVLIVLALAGILVTYKFCNKGKDLNLQGIAVWKEKDREARIFMALFLIIMGFQMYMAFTRASFDGDDAYYNVQALIAQQKDTLYRINPDTGRSAPLDVRHGLALFPIWEAYIGSMSGIHVAIICHSIVPLMLIPLTYILYYQIGKILFTKKKELLPMFMVLISLWQLFGNISIYTTETFFLTRTWQGKSFAGNFVIPAVFFIFLALFMHEENISAEKAENDCAEESGHKTGSKEFGLWLLLACLNLAGGASSSLAVLLSTGLTAGLTLLFAIKEKKFSILMKGGLSCVPGGAYVLLYLLLSHGFLL